MGSEILSLRQRNAPATTMKLFFSVGEPSGDLHGANLIRGLKTLRPGVECVGFGGPRMREVGCELEADLTQLAVMGFFRVVWKLPRFLGLLRKADRYFQRHRPAGVVLIDFPGFNWWIARRAKAHGIPVFYYGVPQLWAWAPWRIGKLRRLTDHVLCKLPFEEPWFRQRGCNAIYVGHPYFDELAERPLDKPFVSQLTAPPGPLVALLPGSRQQEISGNLPWLVKAAIKIRREVPKSRFAVASYNERQACCARKWLLKHLPEPQRADILVYTARTPEVIEASTCCLACSGSVSLELVYHRKPTVILYWVHRWAYELQKRLRIVRYITLANLLAVTDIRRRPDEDRQGYDDQIPFPEYLTYQDVSSELAGHAIRWLTDESAKCRVIDQLDMLRKEYAQPGASRRAAEYISRHLPLNEPPIPRPHFTERRSLKSEVRR